MTGRGATVTLIDRRTSISRPDAIEEGAGDAVEAVLDLFRAERDFELFFHPVFFIEGSCDCGAIRFLALKLDRYGERIAFGDPGVSGGDEDAGFVKRRDVRPRETDAQERVPRALWIEQAVHCE